MGYGWSAHVADDSKETIMSTSDSAPGTRTDPQTQLDSDPVNAPEADAQADPRDGDKDDTGDGDWSSEGGATPAGPATDT